ncbi:glycosyltransferase family 4 protein [Komarekiella sp. 'clone 1']|uniref:Glycosyltransferase family 4 protein n=1 Tax=Komarekiella delphini-convector SJRDD-AB1 TaxID=2593771 RepID=A0AA40SZ38_9NOST|nr:glycosyltransferase family 4 protein [Komarekiella delphini-convector]MBD6617931.1 glycosyltransferase family 4 protein [Komarekiella delphini-convector SJRDD-AB1]
MKILLYSSVFWPSLGGIETITATLAENIAQLGHECIVVTETPSNREEPRRSYQVVRQPTFQERLSLTRECSLVHSNGASVAMYPFARLANKPFIWTHNGYQVSCVDGLGWFDGEPTPMTPTASLSYYLRKKGFIYFLKESLKLAIRRYVAENVDLNIAATHWVAKRQPLRNQIVAYTPYPISQFKQVKQVYPRKYDFIYVGRLVSEKGLPELIQAFYALVSISDYQNINLAIVGDGNMRKSLEKMVTDLQLSDKVHFLGSKHGTELMEVISQAAIGVVPSAWEEPMGGVSLELLAAGKIVITSEFGGHAECIGDAGLKFKNRDYQSLFECMNNLINNQNLGKKLLNNSSKIIEKFDDIKLTTKYIEIYEKILNRKYVK